MEVASATLPLSSSSIPRQLSSRSSTFLANNSCPNLLNKSRVGYISNSAVRAIMKQSRKGFTCNALFGLGVPELAVIAGVAALAFGPKKLPEVGRSIGKTVKSFQQAAKEFESELKREPESTEESPAEKLIAASEKEKEKEEIKV